MKLSTTALLLLLSSPFSTSAKVQNVRKVEQAQANVISETRAEQSTSLRRLTTGYTCFGDHDFTVYFKGACNYDELVERMADKVADKAICEHSAADEVAKLVGIQDETLEGDALENAAREAVRLLCKTAMDEAATDAGRFIPWDEVTGYGENFDKQYYDGKSFWNEEVQTDYQTLVPDWPSNKLETDAERVDDLYETVAERTTFAWPDKVSNFDNCEIRAAMCCWVSDRQANDNNGNCDTPYDERCIDADPADNTELCGVDMKRSGVSTNYVND
jgi:hypothetical protein